MARRGLQVTLTILGSVALVLGALTVLTGGATVPEAGDVSASVESELRFYAAWYVAAGIVVLRTVRRVESAGGTIRAVSAALVLGGLGRLVAIIAVGRPHPVFLALMALEFAIPALIVPWQAAVARRTT
jgi:hypothetical protein